MRSLSFLFAWRYFRAKKSTQAINIIAWISMLAITVGTAALILVLSVFNGFEGLVKSLYSSFYTDLKVLPAQGKVMTVSSSQREALRRIRGIRNVSFVAEEKALMQYGDYQSVVHLKGVDENYRYTAGLSQHIIHGEYDLGTAEEPKIILGAGIESALGVVSGNDLFSLKVYLPRKGDTEQINLLENISGDTAIASATFAIQQDFDNKYGITHIDFVKRAMRLNTDEYTAIEIALQDIAEGEKVKKELGKLFGSGYLIQNKYEQNRSLYSVMNTERWAIYGIFCLVMIVAAFNMIGALTMLVLEKKKDISILHALGSNSRFIQKIFLHEGLLLALLGAGAGIVLALIFVLLQKKFHLIPLQGSFLIDYFPVELRFTDLLFITATVIVIALLASWIPSHQAARQPFSLRAEHPA
ncbi:MAG: FtsX-like permease family protein [Chitinophagaceae bacterium]|nr:FtsX-like permease family protein [Chitinophagaceae bacterium]